MSVRALAIAAVVVVGCHHGKPHRPGEEWLSKVKFEGNHQISNGALLDGLALHRTLKDQGAPDPYQVELDADRLRGQYARDGFFSVAVAPRVERRDDAATVTYKIDEGRRAVTHVVVTGVPPPLAARVRAAVPLADGAPFDYDVYDAAKDTVLGIVQDAGYAHAKLDATVAADPVAGTATIRLAFDTGPRCVFGRIDVQGTSGDLAGAIRARLAFRTGDTYSTAAVAATQRNIYGLSRFSTVQVLPAAEADRSSTVDMKVVVVASSAHQVTFGGGAGADPLSYEARLRGGYEITGWPTPLDTVTIDLRPAYAYMRDGTGWEPRVRAVVRYTRQDLLTTYAVGTAEVGFDYLAYEAFTLWGPRAKLSYGLRLGTPKLKLEGGWVIHEYEFRRPSPLIDTELQDQLGIEHPERVGAYYASLIADFRDHPIEPRWGAYAAMTLTYGSPAAGGAYTYEEVQPEVRGYVPIGPVVLAARARYGAIYGDIPATERFYAGGANSNRGFAERMLSPSLTGVVMGSTVTVPYGGGGLVDSSVEARFPIATIRRMGLGGVVFFDAGDVEDTPEQLSLAQLAYAVGVGLRLHTIVGPVRADVGYRLNRTGADDPEPGTTIAFHISLGEAF
jgi:outer membrane protein assembly factor BamA